MTLVWRPTPLQAEKDSTARTRDIPLVKIWDLSPIDLSSFDPFEPPGRPVPPTAPANLTPPSIVSLGGIEVGDTLAGQSGSWTGIPTPTISRQWLRAGTPIAGATSPGYLLIEADLGLMIGIAVTGTNVAGSATAEAEPVGPIEPAP
jgi:hypothetical protein